MADEITIKDIARRCGVGVSTVSRAMNNRSDISKKTREKVMRVIEETGFVPNNSARNLKRIGSQNIAVLIKGISNPFFTDMINILEAEIKKTEFVMTLHRVASRENEVDVALELVKEKRLQGIIFLGGEFSHSEEKLNMLNVPFVFSTAGAEPERLNEKNYSSISVDDVAESCKIVNYLIGNGHQRIAILAAQEEDTSVGMLRLKGYKKALMQHDIPVDEDLICSLHAGEEVEQFSMENGYVVTKELLARGTKFTALYAISDTLAIGAMRALHEQGIRIPEDVSVAGYDGLPLGDYVTPRLTTLRQPTGLMARETASLLFGILSGQKNHQHLVYPGELIIRESTRAIR